MARRGGGVSSSGRETVVARSTPPPTRRRALRGTETPPRNASSTKHDDRMPRGAPKSPRDRNPSSASTRPSPETYRARWGAAAAKADRGDARARRRALARAREGATIDEVREAVLRGVARGEERRALRSEMLRWHPDKFGARLGRSVRAEDRERTVVRVNAVARMVAELFKRAG